jgi:hypothetical protein
LHIAGEDNFLADMFSPLDRLRDQDHTTKESSVNTFNNFSFILHDKELLQCFLNLQDANDIPFALDLACIAQGQQQDQELWQRRLSHPLKYPEQQFGDVQVLCFKNEPNAAWKICIPSQQFEDLVNWLHQALNHFGLHRLLTTISMHVYHPHLRHAVAE